ncbi:MAG: cytochrome P460 family protein [Amphritea sp.]
MKKKYKTAFGHAAVVAAVVIAGITALPASAADKFSPYVDEKGAISFPEGFRTSMVHLGSWFVPEGGASGFHDVYTEKESVEAFRNTGKFPDGATLVKELRASEAGDYTTGNGVSHSTSQLKQWFVMVKDSSGRFADNPLWGDGWGWALFKPDKLGKNAAANYKDDCLGCHVPAKENDWVYTEAYPLLTE